MPVGDWGYFAFVGPAPALSALRLPRLSMVTRYAQYFVLATSPLIE